MAASKDSLSEEIVEHFLDLMLPGICEPGYDTSKFDRVYQFKITLEDTDWPVWRRFQIASNSTFWGLYVIINNVFLWQYATDGKFTVTRPGTKENVTFGEDSIWREPLGKYLTMDEPNGVALIGKWMITFELEGISERVKGRDYPRYLEGKGSAPSAILGPFGFREMLGAISDYDRRLLSKTRFIGDDVREIDKNDISVHIDGIDPRDIVIDQPDDVWVYSYCEMKVMADEVDDLSSRLRPDGSLPACFPLRSMAILGVHGLLSTELISTSSANPGIPGFVTLAFTRNTVAGILLGIESENRRFRDARLKQIFDRVVWYLKSIQDALKES